MSVNGADRIGNPPDYGGGGNDSNSVSDKDTQESLGASVAAVQQTDENKEREQTTPPANSTRNDTISVLERRDYEMFRNPGENIRDFQARQDQQSADIASALGIGQTIDARTFFPDVESTVHEAFRVDGVGYANLLAVSDPADVLASDAQTALDDAIVASEQRIEDIDAFGAANPQFSASVDPITAYDRFMSQSRLDALNGIDVRSGETLGDVEARTGIDIGGDGSVGTISLAQAHVQPAGGVHVPAPRPADYATQQNLAGQGITVEDFDHNDITRQDLKFDVSTRDTQFYGDQPISQRVPLGGVATGRLGVTTRVTEEGDLRVSYWAGARAHVAPVGVQAGVSSPTYNALDADRVFGRVGFSQEASIFGLNKGPAFPGQQKSLEQLADPKPSVQGGITFQYDFTNPDRPITIAVDYRAGAAIGGGDIGPDVMAEQAIEIQPYLETVPAKSSPNKPGDEIKSDYYTDQYYGGLIEQNGAEYLDTIGLTPERFQEISQEFAAQTNRSSAHVMSELSDTLGMAIEDFNEARQDYGLSVEDALNVSGSFQNGFQGTIDDIINAPIPAFKPAFPSHIPALKPEFPSHIPEFKPELTPEQQYAFDVAEYADRGFAPDLASYITDARLNGDMRTADELADEYFGVIEDAPLPAPVTSTRNDTISVLEQRDYEMFGRRGESIQDFQARQDQESADIIGGVKDFFGGLFSGGQTTAPADPAGTTRGLATDPAQTTPPADPAQTTPKKEENDSSSAEDRAEREAAEKSYSDRGFSSDIASDIADAREDGDHRTADDIASEAHGVDDDDGSDNGGGRVICTYFYQKGELSRTDWAADLRFTQDHISQQTVRGYHLWAIPTVRLMRGGGLAGRLLEPAMRFITLHRAHELAYRMGRRDQGNLTGKLIRWTMEPVCWALGALIKEQDWQSLYTEQDVRA